MLFTERQSINGLPLQAIYDMLFVQFRGKGQAESFGIPTEIYSFQIRFDEYQQNYGISE